MDLGISGRKAIVCASTRGLGRACAEALAAEGVYVFINGRDQGRTDEAAREMRKTAKAGVTPIAADITTQEGRAQLIAACPDADILVNNNEGPPPGKFMDYTAADWIGATENHLIPPLELIRALMAGMRTRKFGRIVNITSATVVRPSPGIELSMAPRVALTSVTKALSRDVAADNVTINNLLPERIDTGRQIQMAKRIAEREKISFEDARLKQAEMMPAKRLGQPSEFGAACAFLCSAQAGFITGQNIRLDGGSYPGLV